MAGIQRMLNARAMTKAHRQGIVKPFLRRGAASAMRALSDRDAQIASGSAESNDMNYGDSGSARRLTKLVSAAVAQSTNIIGVTGARKGVGVSVVSRQLAGAFASFGVRTLHVDLSKATISTGAQTGRLSLLDLMTEVRPCLATVDLGGASGSVALDADRVRDALAEAVKNGFTVIIDLPPLLLASDQSRPAIAAAGTACDAVFLVCLSGDTKRNELAECIDTGRIIGLKFGGVILNDWRLPANDLIES